MAGHHLILGELTDFITGETLADTHDERIRQELARLLVNDRGFSKKEILPRAPLRIGTRGKQAIIKIDFLIRLDGRIHMVVKYGPGSVITRHRPALAAARLVAAYQVPVVVVTNGREADILDGPSGRHLAGGLGAVSTRADLLERYADTVFAPVPPSRAEMESRILYAYEVDGSCPCDDDICKLNP
jgi:hypothetical protein